MYIITNIEAQPHTYFYYSSIIGICALNIIISISASYKWLAGKRKRRTEAKNRRSVISLIDHSGKASHQVIDVSSVEAFGDEPNWTRGKTTSVRSFVPFQCSCWTKTSAIKSMYNHSRFVYTIFDADLWREENGRHNDNNDWANQNQRSLIMTVIVRYADSHRDTHAHAQRWLCNRNEKNSSFYNWSIHCVCLKKGGRERQ